MNKTVIEMKGIRKLFSKVTALEDIEFDLREGEVHALMGENGAGKSTLSKIISGIYRMDGGSMSVNGEQVSFSSTREAAEKGIAIVTQEFSLLPDFSIAENIFLTDKRYYKKGFISSKKAMTQDTRNLLKLFEMETYLDPYKKVSGLSVAQMQVIEILKAVSTNAKIIILDEPTASLSQKEIEQLFAVVRRLKRENVSFIVVSHKINEIYEISDRITVLRDGRLILKGAITQNLSQKNLIKAMVGREVGDLYGLQKGIIKKEWEKEEIVLEARGITDAMNYVKDASFRVHRGEIIGFSGLVGAGRTELVRCIFGADPMMKGEVFFHGSGVKTTNIRSSIRRRMGFVSEDRKQEGLIQEMSVLNNINLSVLTSKKQFIIQKGKDEERCMRMIKQLGIKVPDIDIPVKSLSGGNQQKVLLAKWLLLDPEVLIIDEPTRGVDIGAKADIYAILKRMSETGMAIIIVSSEIPEILGLCDYIYVMREGRITGSFSKEEAGEEKIGYYSTIG